MNILDLFEQKPVIYIEYSNDEIEFRHFGDNNPQIVLTDLKTQFNKLGCEAFKLLDSLLVVKKFLHLGKSERIVDQIQLELEKEGYIVNSQPIGNSEIISLKERLNLIEAKLGIKTELDPLCTSGFDLH